MTEQKPRTTGQPGLKGRPAYNPKMTKDTKSKRAPGRVTPTAPNDPHSISFVKGLVARGEAARADAKGNLPSGATHEIVGEAENGLPIVVRRRFSAH
jgi:hypothetical protein